MGSFGKDPPEPESGATTWQDPVRAGQNRSLLSLVLQEAAMARCAQDPNTELIFLCEESSGQAWPGKPPHSGCGGTDIRYQANTLQWVAVARNWTDTSAVLLPSFCLLQELSEALHGGDFQLPAT